MQLCIYSFAVCIITIVHKLYMHADKIHQSTYMYIYKAQLMTIWGIQLFSTCNCLILQTMHNMNLSELHSWYYCVDTSVSYLLEVYSCKWIISIHLCTSNQKSYHHIHAASDTACMGELNWVAYILGTTYLILCFRWSLFRLWSFCAKPKLYIATQRELTHGNIVKLILSTEVSSCMY